MNIGTLKNNKFSCTGARAALLLAAIATLLGAGSAPVHAEDSEITSRRAAERVEFSNEEIKDGFFKIAFHAEMQVGAPADRIRKFDEPVRIFIDSKSPPDRSAQLEEVIADIRARVDHLDIAITHDREAANFVVMLVRDRDVDATIGARYGKGRARRIKQSLKPQCLSGIGKDGQFRIRRAEAILPVDAGEFTFLDCAYEELLQGLGVINDDASVPWTMFNDDVQMGFFDAYDQYLLNILYDSRVRPGMTPSEVNALMGELLPTARTFVGGATSRDQAKLRDGLPASATSSAGTN
jgi:hypothetical protein